MEVLELAKSEKRLEILQAALKVISQVGFEGAKMEDIAKEAGIGKGTIYEYFDSKNTLFQEMLRHCAKEFREGLSKALAEGETLLEKICNFSLYGANFLNSHALLLNSPLVSHSLPEEIRLQMKENWDSLFKLIEDEVKKGIFTHEVQPNIDPEMAASLIIGGVNQYIAIKIFGDRFAPEEMDHTGIAKLILSGLS